MKPIYTRIAIIVASVLMIVALAASIVTMFQHRESKHLQEIKAKEVANQHTIDSLIEQHREKVVELQIETMKILDERDSLVRVINSHIDQIKIVYDKKVEGVALLPDDSLLRLLSGQLSQ